MLYAIGTDNDAEKDDLKHVICEFIKKQKDGIYVIYEWFFDEEDINRLEELTKGRKGRGKTIISVMRGSYLGFVFYGGKHDIRKWNSKAIGLPYDKKRKIKTIIRVCSKIESHPFVHRELNPKQFNLIAHPASVRLDGLSVWPEKFADLGIADKIIASADYKDPSIRIGLERVGKTNYIEHETLKIPYAYWEIPEKYLEK